MVRKTGVLSGVVQCVDSCVILSGCLFMCGREEAGYFLSLCQGAYACPCVSR